MYNYFKTDFHRKILNILDLVWLLSFKMWFRKIYENTVEPTMKLHSISHTSEQCSNVN